MIGETESFAWRNAGHLTHRTPGLGIAACWSRHRWWCAHRDEIDTFWDRAYCRDIRGTMAWHAFAMEREAAFEAV